MKNSLPTVLILAAFSAANAHAAPDARSDDNIFSLTSGFDLDSGRYGVPTTGILATPTIGEYEAGPLTFKVIVPSARRSGIVDSTSMSEHGKANAASIDTQYGLADTVAAASYNIYSGTGSTFGIDLTGKVKLNATRPALMSAALNDYAAQADAYRNFNRFTALGSLGYKVLGTATRFDMDGALYGTFGGSYRLDDYVNGGIDLSLSQSSPVSGAGRRELSAYVSRKINKNLKARGYFLTDFSSGTVDNSLGAQIYYGF